MLTEPVLRLKINAEIPNTNVIINEINPLNILTCVKQAIALISL